MATYDTNTGVRRIEAGAVITFGDGSDVYTLKLLEPGTYEEEIGFYEPLNFTDRGEQQFPLEGDERPSRVRLSAKYTGLHDAKDLGKVLRARADNGKMKSWTIAISEPDYKGAVTGQKKTWSNCYITSLRVRAGTQWDLIEVEFGSIEPEPATETYGGA